MPEKDVVVRGCERGGTRTTEREGTCQSRAVGLFSLPPPFKLLEWWKQTLSTDSDGMRFDLEVAEYCISVLGEIKKAIYHDDEAGYRNKPLAVVESICASVHRKCLARTALIMAGTGTTPIGFSFKCLIEVDQPPDLVRLCRASPLPPVESSDESGTKYKLQGFKIK